MSAWCNRSPTSASLLSWVAYRLSPGCGAGLPQLMGAVTEDGQLAPALVEARDRKYGLDTAQLRQERQDIEGPQGGVDPAADYHRSGKGLVTELLDILLM
jgi:hypothetical protein